MSQWEEVGGADLERFHVHHTRTNVRMEGRKRVVLPQVVDRLMRGVVAGCVADGRSAVAPRPAEVQTPDTVRQTAKSPTSALIRWPPRPDEGPPHGGVWVVEGRSAIPLPKVHEGICRPCSGRWSLDLSGGRVSDGINVARVTPGCRRPVTARIGQRRDPQRRAPPYLSHQVGNRSLIGCHQLGYFE
jgi:hypothetical protein